MFFKDKTILLAVTGGIAAYKMAELCSTLRKQGCDIHVLMTKNACEFVSPLTFETLTANRVCVDTFDRNFQWNVQHVSLAKKAKVVLVAPATANVIAKMANGIADDMLTTTVLACTCPKIVAPAMNTGMLENPATQENLATLCRHGVKIVEPGTGWLARGDTGKGRLADLPDILDALEYELVPEKDLAGVSVIVTAGPTRESFDPVRFVSNHSSGKMGYAVARAAWLRGADVTLISGPVSVKAPPVANFVRVNSALEMHAAAVDAWKTADIVIKTAAVSDYRAAEISPGKLKKTGDEVTIRMLKNPDILAELAKTKRPGQLVCGFSMETENLLEATRQKLNEKGADMMVANSLSEAGAGFAVDTNIATLLTKDGDESLGIMPKAELAHVILDRLLAMRGR